MHSFFPRIHPIAILFIALSASAFSWNLPAFGEVMISGTITGRVIDSVSKASLGFANVFVAQSTIGTSSSEDGRFTLQRVPPGAHNVIVSLVGYERKIVPLIIRSGDTTRLMIALAPQLLPSAEVQVEAETPKEWKEYLNRFEDAIFGESNPRGCRLLNPEVLNFQVEGTSLIARTDSLVRFDNPYLGYDVRFVLLVFRWGVDDDTGRFVIFPHFTEKTPGDEEERSIWVRHRNEAYKGSAEHFLKSVVYHRTREEGFSMKTGSPTMGFWKPLPEEDLETSTETTTSFVEWDPPGWMQIKFVGSSLSSNLLHRMGRRILIDSSGVLVTPLAVSVEGSWANQRVGDMMPSDATQSETK